MEPPIIHIDAEARRVLAQLLERHPGRRVRIRHDGYG